MFKKFVYNNLRPTREKVQRLDLSMIAGIELNDPTKRRRTIHFDTKTVNMSDREKTPSPVSRRNMPTDQTWTSDSQRIDAPNTTPSSSIKSAHQVDQKFTFLQELMAKQHEDSNNKMDKQHIELINMLKHNKHTAEKDEEVGGFTTEDAPSLDNVEEMDIVTRFKEKEKKNLLKSR
ncbi:hypothetical protein P3S68_014534 [Capsicum galapagoense]